MQVRDLGGALERVAAVLGMEDPGPGRNRRVAGGTLLRDCGVRNRPGDQFTYNSNLPTVTAVSPSSGPVGGGTSVTIAGTDRAEVC